LVTISFAMARRSQVAGIFTGALIGIFQDRSLASPSAFTEFQKQSSVSVPLL